MAGSLADYSLDWEVSREAAQSRLIEAQQFVAAVTHLLETSA